MLGVRPYLIGGVYCCKDLLDELEQAVLILLIEKQPMLKLGVSFQFMQLVHRLVKLVADLEQVLPQYQHVGEKIV